jgi:predicted dehydrogenase
MKPLKVGVVGGGIGKQHIEAYLGLSDKFEMLAFCDIDLEKGKEILDNYPIPHFVDNFEELCEIEDLDVIDICTPTYLHYPQSIQALSMDKHVICEKPIAGSLKDVDHLINSERDSGRRLMPIFQYRFGHGLQKLKQLVDQNIAGRAYLTTVETSWRRKGEYYVTWRGKRETELGGAVLTLAIHAHDALSYILGPIKSVYARTQTMVNPIETEDTASVSLEMADGSLANLAVTTGSVAQISRHRFCFENFSAESNTEPYNSSKDPWQFHGDTPEIEAKISSALSQFEPFPEYYSGQFYRLYEALETGSELPVTLTDARASIELVTAIYYSANTGQRVDIPIESDNPFYYRWH